MKKDLAKSETTKVQKQRRSSNDKQQSDLEIYITKYQKAMQDDNRFDVNDFFKKICEIYEPSNYANYWWRKYGHLYEERDDFDQEYMRIFCRVLNEWRPREVRGESRYGGKGYFQNFFYGSLSHHFTNMVKSLSSNKRNVATRCPICEQWCNTLSTHLREHHAHLLWEHLELCGKSVEDMITCPFCKSYKSPKNIACSHSSQPCEDCWQTANVENIKKHLMSKHSNYLFERFHDMYPTHSTLSSKPMSIHFHDDENEESSLYDVVESNDNFNNLLSLELSGIQQKMISKVLNGASTVKYDASLYKCTQQEFQKEYEGLKNAMILCGIEG
jgi:hypothetical protein